MLNERYEKYEDYIAHQSEKTNDPARQEVWLGKEWSLKLEGFENEFSKIKHNFNKDSKILCLGSRTGQEVQAFFNLGFPNATGIDIVPFPPLTVEGDIHDLKFPDESIDLVYTNIVDHSVDPQKMIQEIERVLTPTGAAFLQVQVGLNQDDYTEFEIRNPIHDVMPLFERSFCIHAGTINQDASPNFAGMNFEMLFQKNEVLERLYHRYGTFDTISVPENYLEIWNDINLDMQNKKLDEANVFDLERRTKILDRLSKRAYYLACLADSLEMTKIAEVGTAQGWQFYSFCQYASENGGKVYSCDPRDVRNEEYRQKFEEEKKVGFFTNATSREMANECNEIELFYIDGLHGKGTVIQDVLNLKKSQSTKRVPVWVFDDFDERFGCFEDIWSICRASGQFKVVKIGETASGKPSHQAIIIGRMETR